MLPGTKEEISTYLNSLHQGSQLGLYVCVCVCVCVCIYMYVHVYMCMCVYIFVYMCVVYMCVCVSVCIHIGFPGGSVVKSLPANAGDVG